MNSFDFAIMSYVNQFSRHSWLFDRLLVFLAGKSLLKGGIFATALWWAWFRKEDQQSHNRQYVILTFMGCIVSLILARALALTLPFRLRPLHQPDLPFVLPYGMTPETLGGWSSFPSDHAALFFTLSAGLFFVSRKVGILALLYSTLFIAFPRVYLGLHYPTDIIAGAFMGIAVAVTANKYFVENKGVQALINVSRSSPGIFFPAFFLSTWQIATMFDDSRALVSWAFELIRRFIA